MADRIFQKRDVLIREGNTEMVEYQESGKLTESAFELKRTGWARRIYPPMGNNVVFRKVCIFHFTICAD